MQSARMSRLARERIRTLRAALNDNRLRIEVADDLGNERPIAKASRAADEDDGTNRVYRVNRVHARRVSHRQRRDQSLRRVPPVKV